ncbi:hypothetical protein [Bosea sp. (in: a-proteobacteria)]|uniref:hypothetical protein n=1 Tax=Bosea sp. (in: a-proteobacteria) TaxID=1871050 RepID=UPI00261607B3|nr:hypothetical protein [Bosea sp. (in: a-proteobacteria)]MCO5092718.1 hypothetical protein [Bosea sp. (in: a-proteobacteria)]
MDDASEDIWENERRWPLAPPGYLFLVPAFNRIGRRLYGDAWQDDLGANEFWPFLPADPVEADPATLDWAKWMVLGERRRSTPAPEPQSQTDLASAPDDGARRPPLALVHPGWQRHFKKPELITPKAFPFQDGEWDRLKERVDARNRKIQPGIEKVLAATRWLYDAIFERKIQPFIMRQEGGDWQASAPDDWMAPSLDTLRARVRNASMYPGAASSRDGSHWIFLPEKRLDDALQSAIAPSLLSVGLPASSCSTATAGAASPTMMVNITRAIDRSAELLRQNNDATKEEIYAAVQADVGGISRNAFETKVLGAGRERAGFPRKGKPGRKRKSPSQKSPNLIE